MFSKFAVCLSNSSNSSNDSNNNNSNNNNNTNNNDTSNNNNNSNADLLEARMSGLKHETSQLGVVVIVATPG